MCFLRVRVLGHEVWMCSFKNAATRRHCHCIYGGKLGRPQVPGCWDQPHGSVTLQGMAGNYLGSSLSCCGHLSARTLFQRGTGTSIPLVRVPENSPGQVGVNSRGVTFIGSGTCMAHVCVCVCRHRLCYRINIVEGSRTLQTSQCLQIQESLGNCLASWFD